jgi:outer membrane biosynthesis protein TonB
VTSPATPECVRTRNLLDRRLEEELPADEEAFLSGHLERCVPCRRGAEDLERAFTALAALSPEDRVQLRSPLADLERERSRSLRVALGVAGIAALLVVGLGLYLFLRSPVAAPQENLAAAPQAQPAALALPEVGGGMGVETDPDYVTIQPEPVEAEPVAVAARPEPVVAPAPQAQPKPVAKKAPPRPQPPRPKAQPKPKPKPKPAPKTPLPDSTQALFARLQVATGLRYRGVTLFFVRDPDQHKRLSSSKSARPASASEPRPRDPKAVVVRPPAGRAGAYLLMGELLDAPFGLRLAPTTRRLSSRSTLPVIPVRYEPLARKRPKPLLKGPVLLPSTARLAQATRSKQSPVATFLKLLDDPSLDPMDRLRLELGEIESEASDLERRVRAIVKSTRGLVGLGLSVGGQPRSLDVFGSSRLLTESLPKLLRGALLEDRLGKPYDNDGLLDPRSTRIERGVTEGRQAQRDLLTLLATAVEAPLEAPGRAARRINARFQASASDRRGGVVLLQGERLVHALGVVPSTVAATKR